MHLAQLHNEGYNVPELINSIDDTTREETSCLQNFPRRRGRENR